MPDPDPASPSYINGWRSRIRCGMTPYWTTTPLYTKFNDLISNSRYSIEKADLSISILSATASSDGA